MFDERNEGVAEAHALACARMTSQPPSLPDSDAKTFAELQLAKPRIALELGKVIVGQHEVIEQILIALFAGWHCLMSGHVLPIYIIWM